MVTADNELPTQFADRDGNYWDIPEAGPFGSYTWVRQAALVRNAYKANGDTANARKWDGQYIFRRNVWNLLEAGRDYAAVLGQFGKDVIAAPIRIAADVGGAAINVGKKVVQLADWLPWLVLAALVVAGIGLQKGTLRINR